MFHLYVFPTRVGVFLHGTMRSGGDIGLPHACGGVSLEMILISS